MFFVFFFYILDCLNWIRFYIFLFAYNFIDNGCCLNRFSFRYVTWAQLSTCCLLLLGSVFSRLRSVRIIAVRIHSKACGMSWYFLSYTHSPPPHTGGRDGVNWPVFSDCCTIDCFFYNKDTNNESVLIEVIKVSKADTKWQHEKTTR